MTSNLLHQRVEQIRQRKAEAEAELEQLLNLPEEPTTDDPDGALTIWFQRNFQGGPVYTYAATKIRGRWYITSGGSGPGPFTWLELLGWILHKTTVPVTIWQATEYTPVARLGE